MYPIHIYEEGTELPSEGTYFVVAGNGTFLHKDNGLFTGLVKVDQISHLDDLVIEKNSAKTTLPKIPHASVMMVKKFFAQVFEEHHGEACVLLYYSEVKGQYEIVAPEQKVRHTAVNYIKPPSSPDSESRLVGTIHSHCDFDAFHSSVDDADEEAFDGLHITFGHVNKPEGMSCSASIVLNGHRTRIDPISILEGVFFSEYTEMFCINAPANDVDFDALQAEVDSWMGKVSRR